MDAASVEAIELLIEASAGLVDQATGMTSAQSPTGPVNSASEFNWDRAERDLGPTLPSPFLDEDDSVEAEAISMVGDVYEKVLFDLERPTVTLADVGGLEAVKKRLNESFLEPMRNPAIAKAFGKSLRGGLLLYGPPGCGKTFMARAVAGEIGASFMTATMTDIFDKFIGESEKNLHEIFQAARRAAPAVLFLDEIDAIGTKRSTLSQRRRLDAPNRESIAA